MPFTITLIISNAPDIYADMLRSIFHLHDKTSNTAAHTEQEEELAQGWRTKLEGAIATRHASILKQVKSWPVCYVHSSLATVMDLYCPPTHALVYVEGRRTDGGSASQTRESVMVALKQYNHLMAKAVTKHAKEGFWHKLADSIGLQPAFVKEWMSRVGSIPKNGVYARTIGHLSGKGVVTATTVNGDTVVIFWSGTPGEYWIEMGSEKCCIHLDKLLHSNRTAAMSLFSDQVAFDPVKLARILTSKLVLL